MIEKIVNDLVKLMSDEQIIDVKKEEDYIYAFTCMIEKFLTLGTIIIISICLDLFIHTLIFLIFFLSLRKRTGGYHANVFLQCYFGTVGTYVLIIFADAFLLRNFRILDVFLLASIPIIWIIGTVNHPNMNMNSYELQESKKAARLILILEIGIIYFAIFTGVNLIIVSYMLISIILCAILLLIAKILNQEVKGNEEN
ncbi:accessory gene regulator B family protein [Clostridium sp. JNZ X4-2]